MSTPPSWAMPLAWACLAVALPLRAQAPRLTADEVEALHALDGDKETGPQPIMHLVDEPETQDWRVGVKLLGASPRQDFKDMDNRFGFGGAVFVENAINDGWQVQSYLSFISFPQVANTTFRGASVLSLSANSAALGVDVHYHLPVRGLEKFYVLGGLMGTRYEFSAILSSNQLNADLQAVGGTVTTKYRTPFQLGTAVGMGFDLDRTFSLGVRYTYISIDDITYATLETGLSLKF